MKRQVVNQLQNTKFILQRQDVQSKALQATIDEIYGVRDELYDMKETFEKEIKEVRDEITLNRHEQSGMKSAVSSKAYELTEELFEDREISKNLFFSKMGHFRMAVYKKVNEAFNTPRYIDVRRVDYRQALAVIHTLTLDDLKPYQLRLTQRQKEIAEANNDDISGLE